MKDKLLHFEKQQTIRANPEFWVERLEKNPKLDIWWLNPRNQDPDCRKLGIAKGYIYKMVKGKDVTEKLAIADGFGSLDDLVTYFLPNDYKGSDFKQIFKRFTFAVIRWEWIDTYWICGCGDYIGEDRAWGLGAKCGICESVEE